MRLSKSDEKEYQRNYYQANKKDTQAEHNTWRSNNRDRVKIYTRRAYLKENYGMSLGDYDQMLEQQDGHCALCDRTPEQEYNRVLSVDHCHDTGRVRGLLCRRCNSAIGRLGDNVAGLERAIKYLQR